MNTSELELHDAVVQGWTIDVEQRELRLTLSVYASSEASSRQLMEIRFSDLRSFSCVADLLRLSDNRRSGNVNYWVPSEGPGISYIYLVDGCLAIDAGSWQRSPES
jgi:hypothetical protein